MWISFLDQKLSVDFKTQNFHDFTGTMTKKDMKVLNPEIKWLSTIDSKMTTIKPIHYPIGNL